MGRWATGIRVWTIGLTVVLTAGCAGGKDEGGATEGTQAERPSSPATIRILEPRSGAVVSGDKVHVKVVVEGARILDDPGMVKPKPDEGHLHIALDGKTVVMAFGTDHDVPVKPGRHLLEAQFVAGDHAPFDPAVAAKAIFTAE